MPSLGPTELVIVMAIALILFGPGKLGNLGESLGKAVRDFRSSVREPEEPTEDKTAA
jgi:sec-independent protein translocase protein TatA